MTLENDINCFIVFIVDFIIRKKNIKFILYQYYTYEIKNDIQAFFRKQ